MTETNELIATLQNASNPLAQLRQLQKELLKTLNAEALALYLLENDTELHCVFSSCLNEIGRRIPLADDVRSFVIITHAPLCITDPYNESSLEAISPALRFDHENDLNLGRMTESLIAVPIPAADSDVTKGVLEIINRIGPDAESGFSEKDTRYAIALGAALSGIDSSQLDTNEDAGPFAPLVERNLISAEFLLQCRYLAERVSLSVGRLLITEGNVPPQEIRDCLEAYYNVPFMSYDPKLKLDTELIEELNRNYLRRQRWVPLAREEDQALVLIDDPADSGRLAEISQILGVSSLDLRVGLLEDILLFLRSGIEEISDTPETAPANLQDLVGELSSRKKKDSPTTRTTELLTEHAPAIVRVVNKLIADAIQQGASDIHVEPGSGTEPGIVRMRIDGVCRPVLEVPADYSRAVAARIKVMSSLDITENRIPQDGKMTVRLNGQTRELRVAVLPTVDGESVVLRILASGGALPMEKLQLSARNYAEIQRILTIPHGIFLAVGPTGSGKTTTLHALLGELNTPEKKIWTAEDPVEITQRGLQQMQINAKVKLDFARALRAFLRADPDVILIGEIRDHETAHAAIEASLTGHFVFSTLHTNSAAETVTRLLDIGLDPINFADAIVGVLAQRLVRTLCPACKEAYTPEPKEIEFLREAYGPDVTELDLPPDPITLYRAKGCEKCMDSGYRGRVGIHELMVVDPVIKDLITHRRPAAEIAAQAAKNGMRTLRQDGIEKIFQGLIDMAQLRTVTVD